MEAFNLKVIAVMDIPQKYEAEFLGYIAKELLHLDAGVPQDIFEQRLSLENVDADWSDLVKSLKQKVTDKSARQHYWSREILPKLRELGFTDEGRRLWIQARQWLAATQFGPWLWEQLTQKAQRTQEMKFLEVLSSQPVADLALHRRPKPSVQQVKAGSELILEMTLTQAANLTLLARETDGAVFCLCPSGEYAPKQYLSAGKHKLPQPQEIEGTYPTFATTELGKEQWIALLTPQSPPFDWLKPSPWQALELQPSHLQQMFEYVKQQPQARLLYTEYQVVE